MKKIVAVASLATLLAGATFAADISFSYTGKNYFQANGNDNIAYDSASREDCMSFGLSNDYAGAIVDFDIISGALKLDQYYAWMNFAAISTQFTAGVWTSRYVDRIKTDAGDLDNEDFELFKPGVLELKDKDGNKINTKSIATDSDNLTKNLNGDQVLAMAAAYTNNEVVPGALMLKFGFVKADWDKFSKNNSDGSYTRNNSYGFIGEAALRMDNLANINLAIKSYHVGQTSLGLFFSPLMIEKLQATVGLSLGIDSWTLSERNGNDSDKTGVEFAADFRLRYAVTDKFSFTTMHNISSYLSGEEADGAGKKWADNKKAMWNMINVTYAFLDNMKFGLTLNHVISDFDTAYPDASKIIVSPSVAIKATEKATVTIAARGTFDKIGLPGNHYSDFTFKVPVLFSFNY